MSTKYFFIITPFSDEAAFREAYPNVEYVKPAKTLFVYEAEENNTTGTYTAYCSHAVRETYWNEWLSQRYYEPSRFITRFGYSGVDAGKIRDESHLQELFERCEMVYPAASH